MGALWPDGVRIDWKTLKVSQLLVYSGYVLTTAGGIETTLV